MEIPTAPTLSAALQKQLSSPVTNTQQNSARAAGRSIEALIVAVKINSSQPLTSTASTLPSPNPGPNPATYTITLRVGSEQFEASSDRPLLPGERIQLKPLTTNRLLVLNSPEGKSAAHNQVIQQHLIQQGLRQALPIQQAHAAAIKQIATLLQAPSGPRHQEISHYIRQLIQTLPHPQQLQTSAGVKQTIKNSGLFLEHTLGRAPAQTQAQTSTKTPFGTAASPNDAAKPANSSSPTTSPTTTEKPGLLQRIGLQQQKPDNSLAKGTAENQTPINSHKEAQASRAARQNPIKNINETTNPKLQANSLPAAAAHNKPPPPLSEPVRSDLKAQLLHVTQLIKSFSTGSTPKAINAGGNLPGTQAQTNVDQQLKEALYTAKGKLNQTANPSTSTATIDATVNADATEQRILQQLQSSLARLQLQQLNTLELQQGAQNETTTRTGFNIEIPVLVGGNQLDTLQIQVEDEPSGQAGQENNSKERVWKITLSFDMEHLGMFHAQLKMIQDSVSATFWAEKKETVTTIKQEFTELERSLKNAGIEVTELQCHQGQPAQTNNRLQQSLIDLKT